MDVKLVAPFIDAIVAVLPQVGVQKVERGKISLKDKLLATMEVTALVGLTKGMRGNIAYSMSQQTARNVASSMMMGAPVNEFDMLAQSAISELANMLAAKAAVKMEATGNVIDISPPTLIIGKNVTVRVSQVQTLVVMMQTEAGGIELNIGLET